VNYSPSLKVLSSLNPQQIYSQYVGLLSDKKVILDLQNAVVRYFVPSVGGPVPSAQKRRPFTSEDIQAALDFLEDLSLEALSNAPDLAGNILSEYGSSTQKERVRRSLRDLVDWALDCGYLAPPVNLIPEGICRQIQVSKYANLPLKRATVRQIFEQYLASIENSEYRVDTLNAIVRFFVPGCGGPSPLHKPARDSEIQAALDYLGSIPLEYLAEAPKIVTQVMQAVQLSKTQQTRIRKAINGLIRWARSAQYLPMPYSVAPWGQVCCSQAPIDVSQATPKTPQTLGDIYKNYCRHLESTGKQAELGSLQTAVVRYFISACEGPCPAGNKATQAEVQAGLSYLSTLTLEHLNHAIELVETEFERLDLSAPKRSSICLPLRRWADWVNAQPEYSRSTQNQTPEPIFNTFRPPNGLPPKKKPGAKMHANRSPIHALGAKKFPHDYINPDLQQQINSYHEWRRKNDVTVGALNTEHEQILQVMGWLHRYEGVPLEDIRFEKMITKSQLIFLAEEYSTYYEYLFQKEKGTQKARTEADQAKERVQRYLDFVGGKSRSLSRRVSVLLALAKFLYRDILGTDDFPDEQDIPVLRRLLKLQAAKKKLEKRAPQTIPYSETSVEWKEVVLVMEQQRLRAEQTITFSHCDNSQGHLVNERPDTALANDLQRFLSIAFCSVIPSRSRTFHDLRIGETFKEGILTKRKFMSVQDLKDKGLWEQRQGDVKFYIHHLAEDFKTGKSMTPALLESEGWWAEMPNIYFGSLSLYDYIRRWLDWGRGIQGEINHNFFFRRCFSSNPMDAGDWNNRIKTMMQRWTGVPVPPKNLRKMFASTYPEFVGSASILLQHSETIHCTDYDMRATVKKMKPVVDENTQGIQDELLKLNREGSFPNSNSIDNSLRD
jgi:hypothetical protein